MKKLLSQKILKAIRNNQKAINNKLVVDKVSSLIVLAMKNRKKKNLQKITIINKKRNIIKKI
jgi:hypothetical protein